MRPGDAASLARYVVQRAPHYNLDAKAVLAVAMQEGISGKVGDNGTSFGPWQLHKGGEYPVGAPQAQAAANAWAWSKPGIDYALGRMSRVAGGQTGAQAIHSIVYGFERPQNPAKEYRDALAAYNKKSGGSFWSSLASDVLIPIPGLGGVPISPGGAVSAGQTAVKDAEATVSFLGKLTDPHFWLRGLEVVGGGILLLLGVYLLTRQVGLAQPVQDAAENLVPGAAGVKAAESMAGPEAEAAEVAA